ncbi:MAG: MFS transporter [Betaproteobacteria bacterium]|nr:MFS transporter [Betaproteobacteria bacterium]
MSASAPTATAHSDTQVIALVGIAHGTSHFFHLILAPLFPWIKEAFGLSYSELGLLMSVFFVVSGIGQALGGFVVDRKGAFPVLLGGIACLMIAALGLAASQSYLSLMMFAGLAGLGNSIFHPADYTLLNQRVSTPRLGHAFSMHGVTGTAGWALAPVFLAGLATLFSWRVALACAALLAAAVLLLLLAYREVLASREVAKPAATAAKAAAAASHSPAFLSLPAVWAVFAFFFITAIALGGIQTFAPSALKDLYGISTAAASMCITVYMAASATGLLAGGFLAARAEHHEHVVSAALAITGALAMLLATGWFHAGVVVAVLALIGFGNGLAGPSRDLMVRAAAPKGATGRVYGVVYSGLDVGLAIAPLMFGAMMDAHHPGWLFIAIGLFLLLAVVTALRVGGYRRAATIQPA